MLTTAARTTGKQKPSHSNFSTASAAGKTAASQQQPKTNGATAGAGVQATANSAVKATTEDSHSQPGSSTAEACALIQSIAWDELSKHNGSGRKAIASNKFSKPIAAAALKAKAKNECPEPGYATALAVINAIARSELSNRSAAATSAGKGITTLTNSNPNSPRTIPAEKAVGIQNGSTTDSATAAAAGKTIAGDKHSKAGSSIAMKVLKAINLYDRHCATVRAFAAVKAIAKDEPSNCDSASSVSVPSAGVKDDSGKEESASWDSASSIAAGIERPESNPGEADEHSNGEPASPVAIGRASADDKSSELKSSVEAARLEAAAARWLLAPETVSHLETKNQRSVLSRRQRLKEVDSEDEDGFSKDDLLLIKMEERENREDGADEFNHETFGPDAADAGLSFDDVVSASRELRRVGNAIQAAMSKSAPSAMPKRPSRSIQRHHDLPDLPHLRSGLSAAKAKLRMWRPVRKPSEPCAEEEVVEDLLDEVSRHAETPLSASSDNKDGSKEREGGTDYAIEKLLLLCCDASDSTKKRLKSKPSICRSLPSASSSLRSKPLRLPFQRCLASASKLSEGSKQFRLPHVCYMPSARAEPLKSPCHDQNQGHVDEDMSGFSSRCIRARLTFLTSTRSWVGACMTLLIIACAVFLTPFYSNAAGNAATLHAWLAWCPSAALEAVGHLSLILALVAWSLLVRTDCGRAVAASVQGKLRRIREAARRPCRREKPRAFQ